MTHKGPKSTPAHPAWLAWSTIAAFTTGRPQLDDQQWNAFIGIVTAIVGNILISFALNLQRYAHIRLHRDNLRHRRSWQHQQDSSAVKSDNDDADAPRQAAGNESSDDGAQSPPATQMQPEARQDHPADGSVSYLRSPWWWAGIVLMIIGETGNFLAYGFAPASIVSPMGVVALISNCIIAPCLLHERFRQRDFWGVMIAIAGVTTLILSAKTSEVRMGPDDIWAAFGRWEFQLYLGLTAGLIVVLMYFSPKYGGDHILIDLGLVALFGAYTALSTKGVASLLSGTLWRSLTFPITYLLAFVLVATAMMQIRYLNRALQRFDSTQVIPTQFVLFTLSVIIGSTILYRDFQSADAPRVAKFLGGCALTFLGVYLITGGRSDQRDGSLGSDRHSFDSNVEEGTRLLDDDSLSGKAETHTAMLSSTSHRADGRSIQTRMQLSNLPHRQDEGYGTIAQVSMSSSPSSQNRQEADDLSHSSRRVPLSQLQQPRTPLHEITHTNLPLTSEPQSLLASGTDPQSDHPSGSHARRAPESSEISPRRAVTALPATGTTSMDTQTRSVSTMTPRRPLQPRKSLSRLFVDALPSPLSSSLSGLAVADALRRGHDSPSESPSGAASGGLRASALRRERTHRTDSDSATFPTLPRLGSWRRDQASRTDDASPSTVNFTESQCTPRRASARISRPNEVSAGLRSPTSIDSVGPKTPPSPSPQQRPGNLRPRSFSDVLGRFFQSRPARPEESDGVEDESDADAGDGQQSRAG